jgi:hypothetical protein
MILEIIRGLARYPERTVHEPVFLVGKCADCDLVLGDPQFSTVHFYLLKKHQQTMLRLVGRSPELTVNGEVKSSTYLNEGDRIRTGPYEFLVRAA